ncbi:MAG: winged helix-turn-helix domain-containing protein, partial [Myxococcota bacterium]
MTPRWLDLRGCSVDLVGHTVVVDGTDPRPLGRREAQLLRYLLDRPGQDVAREELLREVFGTRSRTTRALDMSVRRLRMLIERDPDAPDHLHTARGV